MQSDRLVESFQEQVDNEPSAQMEPNSRIEAQVESSRPLLIYNKVSAVINEPKSIGNSPLKDTEQGELPVESSVDKEPKTGSPVWYEYGCV